MIRKIALIGLLSSISLLVAAQNFSGTPTISPAGPYCAGASITVNWGLTSNFTSGNVFTVQLSNAAGSFGSPTVLGSVTSQSATSLAVTIPLTQGSGAGYLIRIVSTNPALNSANTASFNITALGINAPTVASPMCQGSTFNITNNLSSACSFGTGNTFTVQLSDNTGSFTTPTTIGSLASVSGGAISVTIPQAQTTGAAYAVRVVSSNPVITGTATTGLTISAPTINAPTGLSTQCAGATFNITNNLGTCSFFSGNTFTVQLSDNTGSFASPTTIGSTTATAGGTISVTLPLTTTTSANYRIRVVGSTPSVTGTQSAAFTINGVGMNAPTIATTICQGTTFNITNNLTNACSFGSGNTFTVQLSDQFGSFASPTSIGSSASQTGGTISVSIPQAQTPGTAYLVRVVSSNPVLTGTASGAITINSPGFNAPTGTATRCAGATFNITNNITSCSFFSGNTFTVQLSDASGSFASPVTIGSTSATTGGTISVTLPQTLATGANYKVQVVSSSPALTSSASAAFTVNGFSLNAPTITGGATTYCQGQNLTINYTLANACTFPNTPSNNVFTAQLSDAFGSFASPVTIGTITSAGSGSISANIGNPVAGTGYRIRVVSSNPTGGVVSPDNGTDLTINASTGNPATFGNGVWNAYVYNSNNFTNYNGFYSFGGLTFDTGTQYGTTNSPSLAAGYSGCTIVGSTNYSISFKRTNFTCGYYQIDIPAHDDNITLLINGVQVFQQGCCNAATNVWTGFLNASSTVEFQLINFGGPGRLSVNIFGATNPLTVSPNITQCSAPTNPGVLSASASVPLTYVWTPNGSGSGLTPSSGIGSSVTAAPTATTTYTVTGTDATTGCSVTGTVTVTVNNAKPTVTITAVPTPTLICTGVTTATLTATGATNYTWSPTTGLTPASGVGPTMTANPATATTYTVTGDNGCTGVANSNTATVTVTPQSIPASPPTTNFGNNTWNVYCHYNTTALNNYYGYYTENNLSFNTTSRWSNSAGPSLANAASGNAYNGCFFASPNQSTNYSMSFKRTNFTCGYYQIDIPYHDDNVTLFINGTQVFQHVGCCDAHTNVWTGFLGPTSQVEFQLINGAGPGSLQVAFSASSSNPITVNPAITVCSGTSITLLASSSIAGATYSWANGLPANNGTINSPNSASTLAFPNVNDTYTATLTDAAGTGCSITNGVAVTVNPVPTTTISSNPATTTTYCPGTTYTFTAGGANTYSWSSLPSDPTLTPGASPSYNATAAPTATTTYTVAGTTNCPPAVNASLTVTVNPLPAITTFPSGTWNVYGFNSQTIGTSYQGYYTENGSGASGYDFNTATRWTSGAAPSTANATNGIAWRGCTMNATNISLSFKRTGFTCGVYQINIANHDDSFYLLINGVQVAQHVGCCDAHTNVWTGVLGTNSTVEFQLQQGAGGSGLSVSFTPVSTPATTNLWYGGTNNDWFTASNWCSAVPTTTTDALIYAAGPIVMPAIANTGAVVRNLTINGSIAATAFTNAIAAASLTTSASNNLDVYGAWTNNGTLTPNTGSITFRGSSANTINSAGSETFYNLIINNANGVTIASGTQQVSNQMTFTSGRVTQNATLNILNGATVSGASNSSYVDGLVTKIGNSAFTFPVGNAGFYQPISISAPASATDAFAARYFNTSANPSFPLTQAAATLDHVSAAEYWYLNRTNGSSNVNVTLNWNTNSGGVGNLSTLRVARWDVASAKWQDQGNGSTTGNTTAGSVTTSSAVNSFSTPNSPFTLATTTNANTLPVTLVNFTCALQPSNEVMLTWLTQSEENNNYFTVERSADGLSFTTVGQLKGAGTSSLRHSYQLIDKHALPGTSYYRLVQVDFDGQKSYSEICGVQNDEITQDVLAYPNPVTSGNVTIQYHNIGAVSDVRLLNSLGEVVPASATIYSTHVDLNTSQQTNGLYFVELNSESGKKRVKLIIAK